MSALRQIYPEYPTHLRVPTQRALLHSTVTITGSLLASFHKQLPHLRLNIRQEIERKLSFSFLFPAPVVVGDRRVRVGLRHAAAVGRQAPGLLLLSSFDSHFVAPIFKMNLALYRIFFKFRLFYLNVKLVDKSSISTNGVTDWISVWAKFNYDYDEVKEKIIIINHPRLLNTTVGYFRGLNPLLRIMLVWGAFLFCMTEVFSR